MTAGIYVILLNPKYVPIDKIKKAYLMHGKTGLNNGA